MEEIKRMFTPNATISKQTMWMMIATQFILAILIWVLFMPVTIPTPMEVLKAFPAMWNQGLIIHLISSFESTIEAILLATVISLGLSYLTVLPVFRPIVTIISTFRFLSLVGLNFVFTVLIGGGQILKISLLTFGITTFFVTSMMAIVAGIQKEKYDHARTLRMSEWRVVWEVIVLGEIAEAIEVLRQSAAMGWMMITMVEGIVRSGGGIGTMLLDQNRTFALSAIFALQIVILCIGLFLQDWGIRAFKNAVCPYAKIKLERR